MANLRQDRVPDPTLSHASTTAPEGSAVNGRAADPRCILLSLRLRTQDSSGYPSDVSWAGDTPSAAFAIDILSASGGAADPPHGPVLPVRFSHVQSALLAVRRLQWGLQGLAESGGVQSVAPSIAVHSGGATGVAGAVLERLAPGQVIVEGALAEAVQSLPGAMLRETGDGSWFELLWRSADPSSGFSADEQSVLGLIRARGREDPCPPAGEPPRTATGTTTVPFTGTYQPSQTLGRSRLEPEPASAISRFKWLIVGGAAAVLVLVAVLVIPGMVSGNHAKAPAQSPDASTKSAAPPVPAPAPTAPPVVEKAPNTKPAAKSAKPQPKPDAAPAKSVVTGPCDLTEAEIPRSLSRAENYMYAGKLEEAQAMYQRVLPCPSAHEKALEGLQHVRQRMAAQTP